MSASEKPVLVQKYGGSMLASADGFKAAADVIQAHAKTHRLVVVLSAVKGVTDLLIGAIDTALAGDSPGQALSGAITRQQEILDAIQDAGTSLLLAEQYLDHARAELEEWLEGVRLIRQCPDETRASILATGERFSSRLLTGVLLGRGMNAAWSDGDLLPPANSDRLDTLIDIPAATPLLEGKMSEGADVLVLPGFFGINSLGEVQLLGRNGTDYSAAAVAAAVDAELCQIWKDVDGFFSADPGVVSAALCLDEVSYEEAMELTYFGASVISPKALAPLAAAGIPCQVRNAFNTGHPGTKVHDSTSPSRIVRGITHLPDVALLTIQGGGLRGTVGIARRVTEALANSSISILLIVQSSSEYSITLCVRQADVDRAAAALEEAFHFERLHGLVEKIHVQRNRAVVSLVGDGMKHFRGIAARFLTAISAAGINVEAIAQGSTECAIAVVVEGNDAVAATRACHTAFFSKTSHLDVILLGCGNVGSELMRQFEVQAPSLLESHIELRVRAIANSHSLLSADKVIDLENWEEALKQHGKPWSVADLPGIRDRLGLINPTVIDCTSNEDLAGRYVELMDSGFHVVTANKKANTADMDYYRDLRSASSRNSRKFLYETNVGAGLPVIDTLQALMRSGDELKTFEGILSGSLSMILGLLDDDVPLSGAVEKAMSLGYTEPDARDDLSGMDVARKLLIVAREVGLELELEDIDVQPVVPLEDLPDGDRASVVAALERFDAVFRARVEEARSNGMVLRYVGRIEDGKCRVSIEETPVASPLGAVRDGENALVLHTRYYAPIPLVLRGYGAGGRVTAAGVFADLLRTVWRPLD